MKLPTQREGLDKQMSCKEKVLEKVPERNSTIEYKGYQKKIINILIIMAISIVVLMYVVLRMGVSDITVQNIIETLMGKGTDVMKTIIWKIRMPRIVGAVVAGAALSLAGCIMQNNLKNPLASPSTLGVTSAAAFGANFAIIFLGSGSFQSGNSDAVMIVHPYVVTLNAFIFSMIAVFIIMALAKLRMFTPNVIILVGVAISSLFGAGTTFLQYFANEAKLATAVFWTFGNLGRVSWKELGIMSMALVAASAYFMFRSWDYNAMINGDDCAKSLGVNTRNVRLGGMFFSSLLVAIAVSFMGIISFIGLISPQIMRRIIGNDHRFLIPGSALFGSLILLVSDTVARTIISPVILPVGVITSFMGAPLFIYILMRDYKN
jgi:iron complex transport system permease protein